MTKNLSITQAVKSIVSASALARKIRTEDLGVSGPAALDYELTPKERKYLDKLIEKRGDRPEALVAWISRVLSLGVGIGLLKRQTGILQAEPLYELSHDAVSPFLQQFATEYENWIRTRWTIVYFGVLLLVFVGPFLAGSVATFGIKDTLLYALDAITVIGGLVILIFVMRRVFTFFYEALAFPLMRTLIIGDPSKSPRASRGA
jgi:hypothetical protein